MADRIASHYSENLQLADVISQSLRSAGNDLDKLTTADLATVDEFHIRGRKATLELAAPMNLNSDSHVLDIGSGLGGPARTVAETYGCRVTGIDLTQAFCDAANTMSDWVGLAKRVSFKQGDATNLPFADKQFDAAMTIHVAMNIANKDKMYAEARRVIKSGGGRAARRRWGSLVPSALGTRPVDQLSSSPRSNEISSDWCRIQTAGCPRLDRREPELFREGDRANGEDRRAAGGLAALLR
jgi:SAM-dependent methyltransferase